MSRFFQVSASREDFGIVTKTIPLFGGEIQEGEVVKIIARYKDSAGGEHLTIKSVNFECNGLSADRVVVKPVDFPF